MTSITATPATGAPVNIITKVAYRPFDLFQSWTYGNGKTLDVTRDANGWITGWGGIDPTTSIYSLFRSPAGRIDAQVARPYAFRFDYDGLGHVSEVRAYTGGQVLREFGYDPTGDRTSMTAGGQKQSYLYEPTSHRLTLADGKARRYDAAGNTIGIGDATLDFDAAGRLASASEQGKALVTYGYDALGQRIVRRAIAAKVTTRFLYDENGRWLADYDDKGTLIRQAIWLGDYLVAIVDHGTVLFAEPDHLGGPRAIIDPQRKLAIWRWHPTDDPFGTAAPDEDPDADGTRFVFDLRFPGQRYDDLTGLHYNYFHDYDPVTGRYIEVDPVGLAGGINPYLYADGAPLAFSDPYGLWPQGRAPSSHSWKQAPGLGGAYGNGVRVLPKRPAVVDQTPGAWPSAVELKYTLVCAEARCDAAMCSRFESSFEMFNYDDRPGLPPSTKNFSALNPGCTCTKIDFLDQVLQRRASRQVSMPASSAWDAMEGYTRYLESFFRQVERGRLRK